MKRGPHALARRSLVPRLPRGGRGIVRLLLLGLVLVAAFAADTAFEGRVASVPDGDTLVVYTGSGATQRVRLYGVDCPELGQPSGPEAAKAAADLALFTKVALTVMDTDRYDRHVAVVTLPGGATLNEELLRQGLAWHYARYCAAPFCRDWKELEKKARAKRRGLWAQSRPQAPWKWRSAHPR